VLLAASVIVFGEGRPTLATPLTTPQTPFDTTSARLAGLGLPGASLLRTPAVAAATAFLSHSVPTLVQLWFLTDMCLLCRDAVQR
jgi:hypothetical protein